MCKYLDDISFDMNQPSHQKVTQNIAMAAGDREVSFEILSLPLYAVGELERLLKK